MIVPVKKACRTTFIADALDPELANALFLVLRDEIPWQKGIKSKHGETRLAYMCKMGEMEAVDTVVIEALSKLGQSDSYGIMGLYLNYYRDGEDWTPNHTHPGSHQLVVSLGATRRLDVAKKHFMMTSGSAIIFGSASHGVPKEPEVKEARISIATFMVPIKKVDE